jgi:hypothetical protein
MAQVSPYQPQTVAYPVQVEVAYPERQSRLIMFFRGLLIIPNFFVLGFVGIAALAVAFCGWWAVMFTGRYPRGMHDFVAGYVRWLARADAYYLGLTDVYPPFTID